MGLQPSSLYYGLSHLSDLGAAEEIIRQICTEAREVEPLCEGNAA